MITLLHHSHRQTCYIYFLVMIRLVIVPYNQYQIFFLNCLLGRYQIVIYFVHTYMITICQAKNSHTRKNNLEKYIAPFPRLIIMNIPNCFVKFVIVRNTDEFCRGCSILKNFSHPQVLVHPHEISSHPSIISSKKTNFFIVKLLIFLMK